MLYPFRLLTTLPLQFCLLTSENHFIMPKDSFVTYMCIFHKESKRKREVQNVLVFPSKLSLSIDFFIELPSFYRVSQSFASNLD